MKCLIVSILSFLSLATICQARNQIELFYNEQRPGGDYAGLRVENVDECIQACENDRRCRAFDFDTYERQCWLKDRVPRSRVNRTSISGVKNKSWSDNLVSGGDLGSMVIERNTIRSGGDYKTLTVESAEVCANVCAKEKNCKSFNYGRLYGDCWLKYTVPEGAYNANGISGYKRSPGKRSEEEGWTTGEVLGLYLENNTQRRGGTYQSSVVKNARACVKLCAADSSCQSFNYAKDTRECRLKTTIPRARSNANLISGYKPQAERQDGSIGSSSINEMAGLRLEQNTKRIGGDYSNFTARNVRECAQACANDRRCQSFNYGKKRRDCWLKDNIPAGTYNETVTSGYKARANWENDLSLPARFQVAGLSVENNTRRYGGNYAKFTARNVEDCARSCAKDGSCRSFNYNKQQRSCFLKDIIPDVVSDSRTISGYKPGSRTIKDATTKGAFEVAGILLENNVKRNGGDYRSFTVRNLEECAVACASDTRCRSINYGKENRDCWLKKSVPKGVPNKTVISGVKKR